MASFAQLVRLKKGVEGGGGGCEGTGHRGGAGGFVPVLKTLE